MMKTAQLKAERACEVTHCSSWAHKHRLARVVFFLTKVRQSNLDGYHVLDSASSRRVVEMYFT